MGVAPGHSQRLSPKSLGLQLANDAPPDNLIGSAKLLGALSPTAGLVTVIDGTPGTLSWIGGLRGNRVSPLGLDRFGQTGDLPNLYREYRLDTQPILDAAAELFL
jgi:pyruvate dehydrogenase E1 component